MRILRVIGNWMFRAYTKPHRNILVGMVMFVGVWVSLTQHQFTLEHNWLITQEHAPLIYWSVNVVFAAVGAIYFVGGVYCMMRRRSE